MKTIDFYDFPCKYEGVAWNVITWRTRFTLNYKGLPYRTIWVEYPDVEATCKKLGVAPTSIKPDGSPFYTLPMIHDPNTGSTIAESFSIAEYLDKTYPDTPRVIPQGTRALQLAFVAALWSKVGQFHQFCTPKATWSLNERSEGYFRRTREEMCGLTMEDLYPKGDKAEEGWKKAEVDLAAVDRWLKEGGEFVMGDEPCFADFALGGVLVGCKALFGEDSKEWKQITEWHNGRWGRYSKSLEKYEKVV
ncbi:hypothetical protein VNI00_002166 [Paramarasmius palmivorus]|uniref:GST N-terminal domain-containing protein n=1 Tax=Paramarasmius palmivorus TaxID=297713 RepID=A0AAW0E271_9AGAR